MRSELNPFCRIFALSLMFMPSLACEDGLSPDAPEEVQTLAQPLLVQHEICGLLQVDYNDGHVGDWTNDATNDTIIAHGIRVRVTDNSTGVATYYWADVETGCVSPWLDPAKTYTVRFLSKAKVTNDNIVQVLDERSNPVLFGWTATGSLAPSGLGSTTFTWPTTPGGSYTTYVSNILAASAFSLKRRYGGLSNTNLYVYKEPCPNQTYSCVSTDFQSHNAVFLSNNGGTHNKFQISHEIGHLIGRLRDQGLRTATSGYGLYHGTTSGASTTCATGTISANNAAFNHSFDTEEFNTAAANEGMAHFYAAAVWNWPAGYDCQWFSYYDGSIVDCEGGSKYLTNTCHGGSFTTIDSGSELDWMRGWWDVHSDCDISFGKIMTIWDEANPNNWSDANVTDRIFDAAEDNLSAGDYDCFKSWMIHNGVIK